MIVSTAAKVERQINDVIKYLVEVGLASAQHFAFQRLGRRKVVEVTFRGSRHISTSLKNRDYNDIYEDLARERAYNVRMIDGALIQMMYEFVDARLRMHRLAFFSAPHLEEFQNDPDLYFEDELYADVSARNIVPFPIRFDYDVRADQWEELTHPKSHLSLGQYVNCRIPVTRPVTPVWFIDFVLRNFYNSAFSLYSEQLPRSDQGFAESILPKERDVVHVAVPA